ncbi:MAG: rod shape-determining protein, partial [Acidobacteriaceae bacterium]|nr:rod shape-determining protein [Acidobacteriaceae bacterium]
AETIKMELGSADPLDSCLSFDVRGRDLISGLPRTVAVTDSEIREALKEAVTLIVDAIRAALERIPPELSGDLSERGIVLTGGSAMLKNLDRKIRAETGLPLSIAGDPFASVVLGAGKIMADFKHLRRVCVN